MQYKKVKFSLYEMPYIIQINPTLSINYIEKVPGTAGTAASGDFTLYIYNRHLLQHFSVKYRIRW